MKMVLDGKKILKRSGLANTHQLSLKVGVSYPTVDRYLNKGDEIRSLDIPVLVSILTLGLGLTPEEILTSPMSDFFKFTE